MRAFQYCSMLILTLFLGGCAVSPTKVNFTDLTRPSSPNYYLACPKGDYCNLTPDQVVPIYPISIETLKAKFMAMLAQQPRITELSYHAQENQYQWIQRSLIFRFPDYITVQFYAVDADHSTLAIVSHSKYGYSDFGVNQKRVETWLAELSSSL